MVDKPSSKRKFYRRSIYLLWILAVGAVLSGVAFFIILAQQDLPTFEDLENPKIELATRVLTNDHQELDRLFIHNRVQVKFEDLNPFLVDALVATEDERYYHHAGIDMKALGRVLVKSVLLGDASYGGGSTITQQLAKLLYPRNSFSGMGKIERAMTLAISKFKEWITAAKLEKSYTKEEIIAMYLNKFSYINDSYGINSAAETYFGKNQSDLTRDEAAVLVGMLKNPVAFNPIRFPEHALSRRNVVLKQMLRNGKLDSETYDSLKAKSIDMSNFKRKNNSDGVAPYLMQEIKKRAVDILAQEKYFKSSNTPYNIYKDGLEILTTIDPTVQRLTYDAVLKHMPKLQSNYNRHWKGMNPLTYDAEDEQIELRNKIMKNEIYKTDRYKNIRYARLGKNIQNVQDNVANLVMTDTEINWMLDEEKQSGRIAGLQAKGIIKRAKAQRMRKILASDEWKALKVEYLDFQKSLEANFNKKVKMKVFDYESPGMEKEVDMSPMDSIRFHMAFLQTGVVVLDSKAGYVKAWVGGINHNYFKYDHVTSHRQVGSTFKPFVYTTAVMHNISPCTQVIDQAYTISPGENGFYLEEPWTPSNSKEFSGEKLNLKEGLKKSLNSFSVWLMKQFGSVQPVKDIATSMGMPDDNIPPVPSIALGTPELSVEELAGAYAVFANNGEYNKPYIILSIKDKNGKLIYEHMPYKQKALPSNTNYAMLDMLKYAIGAGAIGIESEVGGKTGTTNDHVDGWFMGITPHMTIGVWVGGDYGWIRFRTLAEGQGGVMARPIFKYLMENLEKQPKEIFDKTAKFYRPPGDLGITINCAEWIQDPLEDEVDPFEQIDEMEEEFDIIEQF